MSTRGWILLALVILLAILALIALLRSPPMRTASQRQIERETAAIQRQVPDAPARPAETENVRSLCRERTRRNARHAARVEEITGMPAVNPYRSNDAEFVEWAIALAEMHTEIAHAKSPINQFNH